jgi:dolichyl-phosphate-mannose--protein O-mannosyl transferase
MERENIRNLLLPLLGIMLLGAFLRIYGIPDQPPLLDEIGSALSAVHYMEGGQFGPTMEFHPNLRNILIYVVGEISGYGAYSLRSVSIMTGILSIPVIGFLLYTLTGNRTASLMASFFLSVEQVHVTFSRQSIQETWTVFFILLGVMFAVLYHKKEREFMLVLSGAVFGLGMASKLHALFPLLACLGAGLYLSWKERSFPKAVFVSACLVILPLLIYILTYLPWFGRGYGIADWIYMQTVNADKMIMHTGNPMIKLVDTEAQ